MLSLALALLTTLSLLSLSLSFSLLATLSLLTLSLLSLPLLRLVQAAIHGLHAAYEVARIFEGILQGIRLSLTRRVRGSLQLVS